MDSRAYSLPGMCRNTQLSPTSGSVINLGHMCNVPLIRAPSELTDGYEPHDMIYSGDDTRGDGTHEHGVPAGSSGVPGWCGRVGTGRVLYRVPNQGPGSQYTQILVIFRYIRFIRPFD